MNDLEKMRHSAAHVMAEAVLDLFPEAKLGIGPPIEDGFYYDFDLPRPLTPDDLAAIEERMRAHVAADEPFESEVFPSREAALEFFAGQPYKEELIRDLPEGETISLYRNGPFVDLCRGEHVASTGRIGAVKLMNVAGAYWRGDEHRPMLQRIYGTAWPSAAELDAYLAQLEEARKRDHRKLGRELGLFVFAEGVGPGIPLFTPKGETLRFLMEGYVREAQTRHGYQHVWTGHLVREDLYHKSGHYENYADVMFPPMVDGEMVYRLKPMNCPSHMTLYNEMGVHSYRDLPLRFAEFATLYRYELSGALSGLTRVRALTQDDCHIFCTEEQIREEFSRCLRLITEVLGTYGLTDYRVQLSLPGAEGKYVRDDEKWAKAVAALSKVKPLIGFDSLAYDDQIAKVSLIGAGMKSHPGVTAVFFEALSEAGVNAEMISTSEIRISVVCRADAVNPAVQAIHTAFDLDADGEAVVYGGTGR